MIHVLSGTTVCPTATCASSPSWMPSTLNLAVRVPYLGGDRGGPRPGLAYSVGYIKALLAALAVVP